MSPRRIKFVIALALCLHAPLHAEEKPAPSVRKNLPEEEEEKLTSEAANADAEVRELMKAGKPAEAEKLVRSVLERQQPLLGEEHPIILMFRGELLLALSAQGKHAEVEPELRALLALQERYSRPQSHTILWTRRQLAEVLSKQGKHVEAEKEYRTLLATRRQKYRANNVTVFAALLDLAQCLSDQGRGKEALDIIEPAETEFVELWGAENPLSKQSKAAREQIQAKLKAPPSPEPAK